jgi:D-glycero-D-manno-heptose 1,7-bisphosphate phosphatase
MHQINILFVDIDGTLTTTKSGKPFKQSPDDIKPLPGSQKAITHFANRGYKIFGVSNQGGCDTINSSTGKPFKTVDDTIQEMRNTLELYPEINIIYFCPSMNGVNVCVVWDNKQLVLKRDENTHLFRKPDIGMIDLISYDYEFWQGLLVGDREEDKQCAESAKIPFMWASDWRFKYGSFV